MAILSDKEIISEFEKGNIHIEPFDKKNVQPNSYNVSLGEYYYREMRPNKDVNIYNIWDEEDVNTVWDLNVARELPPKVKMKGISKTDKLIWIRPGERILCHTEQNIGGLKNITTMMSARSSVARNFISICLCSNIGNVSFSGKWTLEVNNFSRYYTIPLRVGMNIGQIVFFRTGETDTVYKGKYQTDNNEEWSPENMLPKLYLDEGVDDEEIDTKKFTHLTIND